MQSFSLKSSWLASVSRSAFLLALIKGTCLPVSLIRFMNLRFQIERLNFSPVLEFRVFYGPGYAIGLF